MNAAHEPTETQETPVGEDRLLTVKEACALMQIERHHLSRLVHAKRISVIRLGTAWRFLRSRLIRELEALADTPVQEAKR